MMLHLLHQTGKNTTAIWLLVFSVILIFVSATELKAVEVEPNFNPVIRLSFGTVSQTALQPDGKVIIAGDFTTVDGVVRRGLARLNADGSLDNSFDAGGGANSTVSVMTIQPDGKILIGGNFLNVGGVSRSKIARLNSDGSLDTSFISSISPGSSGTVLAITPANGKIYIGGTFESFSGGINRNGIARLETNGSLDATFNLNLSSLNTINVIKPHTDGKILIGGNFSSISGSTRVGIARLESTGSLDASFNSSGQVLSGTVYAVAVQSDGKVLVGGSFQLIGGQTRLNFVRLEANGTSDIFFNNIGQGATSTVRVIELQTDGKGVIGGDFTSYNSNSSTRGIARTLTDGNLDTSFSVGSGAYSPTSVYTRSLIIQAGGKIIAGGGFTAFNEAVRSGIARFETNGNHDAFFNPRLGFIEERSDDLQRTVFAAAIQPDGKTVIAGYFFSVNGIARNNIARFNADGSLDFSFNPQLGVYGGVKAMALQADGKILIGGNFTHVNGIAHLNIARFNADGSLDNSFSTSIPIANGSLTSNTWAIQTITTQADGKILVGGIFDTVNGISRNNIVRLETSGQLDAGFTTNVGNGIDRIRAVGAIAVQNDQKIVVGGYITSVNGTSRTNFARINSNGTLDTSFVTGTNVNNVNSYINSIAIQNDGNILIAGNFSTYAGTARNRIARVLTNAQLDTSFNPGTGAYNNDLAGNTEVESIALQSDGKILIGGDFATYNGIFRNRLARINSNGSLDETFNLFMGVTFIILPFPDRATVYSVTAQPTGKIVFGGQFTAVNNISRTSVTRLFDGTNISNRTRFDFDGDGKADVSVFRPSNGTWYINQSLNGFTGINFGIATDKIVPADYDGDGKTDVAVYRNGTWYLLRSQLGFTGIQFGNGTDIPVPADYDGDGRSDIAVFRPGNGTWYLQRSTQGFIGIQFGQSGDKPVPADYDGDGKADIAVNRQGIWYIQRSLLGFFSMQFGDANDKLVPADYDGDGRADVAVFRPSNGTWYLQQSTDGFTGTAFGLGTDLPTPADYDGDGKTDIAVFRNGSWYLRRTTAGFTGIQFGAASDQPLPNAFVP